MNHPRTRRRVRRSPGRALARAAAVVAAGLGVLALGVTGVVAAIDRMIPDKPVTERCAADLDGTQWYLSPDQAQHAALFAAMAHERDLPARAVTLAIATGLQESKLTNIDYGDRDSVGLFQQRPSQGWGEVEQLMDPVYATGAFYDALMKVDGYEDMEITVAAQAVQRSGFPDAYAQHEGRARAWANALAGYAEGAVTCALAAPDAAGSPDALAARVARDLPTVGIEATPTRVSIDAVPLAGDGGIDTPARAGTAVAAWAVAVAQAHGVTAVGVGGQVWSRAENTWTAGDVTLPDGLVQVDLAD